MFSISLSIAFLTQFIINYGYIALFLLMLGESTVLPIPSEIVLPFVGFLVWEGLINPLEGFTVAFSAALIGSVIMFYAGKLFTQSILIRYGNKFKFPNLKRYSGGVKWFKKYGDYFAFVTKLLPLVRSIASAFCGAYKMSFRKFLLFTAMGIAIWTTLLILVGYYVSSNWFAIGTTLQNVLLYPLALFILFVIAIIFRGKIKKLKALFYK